MVEESAGLFCLCPAGRAGAPRLSGMDDRGLLERLVVHQDDGAFEALVRRHGPRVRAACRRWLRDAHAVEDACQETFLLLLRKAHLIGKPALLAGWLLRVASRVALRARARAARRGALEKRAAPERVAGPASDRGADPAAEAARRDVCTVVAAAVNTLPERYRSALVLYYWEGKTSEEIARQLDCPTGSMSWRLGRGRELLRRRLSGLGREGV